MKLNRRYNYINIIVTTLIFLLVSLLHYKILNETFKREVDKELFSEREEIIQHAKTEGVLPTRSNSIQFITTYKPIQQKIEKPSLRTIDNIGPRDFRRLVFSIELNNQHFEVLIQKPLEDSHEILRIAIIISLVTLGLVLILLTTANNIILKFLWRPFYKSLNVVKRFRLGENREPHFPSTSITEFSLLNETLDYTMSKANRDYLLLKEFTENASHELQTPLAIIRSKLDVIIQDVNISADQLKAAEGAYGALKRLSNLNQSLLLLAKIENNQYGKIQIINLVEILEEKIIDFEDILKAKEIRFEKEIIGNSLISINPELCDILLNNLIGNAIEYNNKGGMIKIMLNETELNISNTSVNKEALQKETLFRRFSKSGNKSMKTGLGLAIASEICKVSAISLDYQFRVGKHEFSIKWKPLDS